MWIEALLALCTNILAICAIQFPFDTTDSNSYRLPTAMLPTHYDLQLRPNFYMKNESLFQHRGRVRIYMNCMSTTSKFTLHAEDLDIEVDRTIFQEVTEKGVNRTIAVTWSFDTKRYFLKANLSEPVIGGRKYTLELEFSAPLKFGKFGIYVNKYTTTQDKTEYFLTTNLAPTYARQVFPCFDEPGFRATFDISIMRKTDYRSLSNMPIESSRKKEDGWVEDTYLRTVIMPTYILGITICKFESIEVTTKSGVKNRIWARPDKIEVTKFFLNYSANVVEAAETYFGIPYDLPKLDHVAIPGFAYYAMENWGIIMYRASRFHYTQNHGSPEDLQWYMFTVAHEVGHLWFGNMVTMKWWTELWLKEGFAEMLATYIIGPKGSPLFSEEYTGFERKYSARKTDSFAIAKPTRYPSCKTRSDITQAYHKHTLYAKGGILNQMFQLAIGNETYRKGLQKYLKTNSYKAADQWALFEALKESIKENGDRDGLFSLNVTSFLGTWLWQPGYPVITIKSVDSDLLISQSRFLYPGNEGVPHGIDVNDNKQMRSLKYDVPLLFRHNCDGENKQNKQKLLWLYHDKPPIKIPNQCAKDKWLLVNAGAHGYYRVNYDRVLWKNIAQQLHDDYTAFTTPERANLLDDVFSLFRYGVVDFDVFINVISYIKYEKRRLPWMVFQYAADDIYILSQSFSTHFKDFLHDMVSEIYDELIWDPLTDEVESQLTLDIIKSACKWGYPPCLRRAKELYTEYINTGQFSMKIKYLNGTIACAGARDVTETEWEELYEKLLVEVAKEDKERQNVLMSALACNVNPDLRKRIIERILSNETLLEEINGISINAMMKHSENYPNSTSHLHKVFKMYLGRSVSEQNETADEDSSTRRKVMRALTRSEVVSQILAAIYTAAEQDKFNESDVAYFLPEEKMSVYMDTISTNIYWMSQHGDKLTKIIQDKEKAGVGRWTIFTASSNSTPPSLFLLWICIIIVNIINRLDVFSMCCDIIVI